MVRPYIKTTLSPGSGVVNDYFEQADMQDALDKLGFTIAGYGCMTCIGNSGEITAEVQDAIIENDLVASAVLSGNRSFEGRVHQQTRANYLAYALAGRCDIDFETEHIGVNEFKCSFQRQWGLKFKNNPHPKASNNVKYMI